MIKSFNPDKHSLHQAAECVFSLDPRKDVGIRTLREEYGFSAIEDDLSVEDLEALIRSDKDGSDRVWSSWREFQDAEIVYEIDLPTPIRTGPPYEIIYADPPWPYRNKKTGGSHKSGSEQHYDVMTMEDIQALPVADLADKRCALFLWATVPLLPDAIDTMICWGWTYKTSLFWHKLGRLGMGYWWRGQMEVLLFGIRGKVPAFRCQSPNYVDVKPTQHSRKPIEMRNLILGAAVEHLDGPRIELFSRDSSDEDWDHWGGEHVYTDLALRDGVWEKK